MNLKQIKQHVTISPGNMKVGKIPSISLPPIKTCNKKADCTRGACYALKSYRLYPSVKSVWNKNFATYNKDFDTYFNSIDYWLKIKTPRLFRWHVSGDIPDLDYFSGMCMIAAKHPKVKFLAFTKKYKYVSHYEKYAPENLTIILSAWPGFRLPESSLPIAYMQDGTEKRINNHIECFGNCETCSVCWNLKKLNKNVVFNKH